MVLTFLPGSRFEGLDGRFRRDDLPRDHLRCVNPFATQRTLMTRGLLKWKDSKSPIRGRRKRG